VIRMDRKALIDVYRKLDRSHFLDGSCKSLAEYDGPLPIGFGQTISQPTLVVEMTAQLDPDPDSRVLEIGTGSGYQTALLAPFCKAVYTVERVPELGEKAKQRLLALGYNNIHFRIGDGSLGWPEEAPFDRIIVTAAASIVPPTLVDQLAPNGRMVIPVGPAGWQDLMLVTKSKAGRVFERVIEKVTFVELVGLYGWPKTGRDYDD
jgi:protein-L-isoaspartate(D-aspartate) O-methyltransferase